MPRTARKISESNIYHVMLRGINRQDIFEDDGDRHYFMTTLRASKEASGFKLYGFCLMSNHVHLLMEPADEPLGRIFRRVGAKYVHWYNKKYDRVGHLFQDRFKSENVVGDLHFITVLRYILQNPVKAGMVSNPGNYRWSSFPAYIKGNGSITDIAFAESFFAGHDEMVEYLLQGNDDTAMDEVDYDLRLQNERAKDILVRVTGCESVAAFQALDKKLQKEYARQMYLQKVSTNQISRLTGMPRTSVFRAVKTVDYSVQGAAPSSPLLREWNVGDGSLSSTFGAAEDADDVIW
ncbi:MAG: transposase [Clostridia bacterium]|nr:transposase [Clostridia bacterium]